MLRINMSSLKFRFKKLDETRNYLLDEINHNDLMSEKYKKIFKYLNCIEHLLILVSAVTVYVSISAFSSLFCVPVGVTRSAVGMTLCEITTIIKSHQSIIKKKKGSMMK